MGPPIPFLFPGGVILDRAALERDLRFLDEFVASPAFESLVHEQPIDLQPGMSIVDLPRFVEALRGDLRAGLTASAAPSRAPATEAAARLALSLVESLRDLLERRASEEAGWEALAELPRG